MKKIIAKLFLFLVLLLGMLLIITPSQEVKAASQTIGFNDTTGQDRILNGQYPAGVIDWGTNNWYLSGPWRHLLTKSISFNGTLPKSESFSILTPNTTVTSIVAFNGRGTVDSVVTLSCNGQNTVTTTVLINAPPRTIATNWTGLCTTVTIGSGNGWNTNFDNLVIGTANRVINSTMSPITINASINGQFTVDLIASTGTDKITAAKLNLTFDRTRLQAQTIVPGTMLPLELATGTVNNTNGTASIAVGTNTPSNPPQGAGTIARITFKALGAGPTPVRYALTSETSSFGKTGNTLNVSSGTNITVAGATPTPVPTPSPSPTSTPSPSPTSTPSPSPVPTQTVTFNDLSDPDRALNGQYPTGVINWGSGSWYLSAPWQQFVTNSVGFTGPTITSRNFSFVIPRRLISITAFNGGTVNSTLTLTCDGNTLTRITTSIITAAPPRTVTTGWLNNCFNVTIGSTNGWNTNFDNLVIQ